MAAIPRPTLNRIPGGEGLPLAKEKHTKDLTSLTRIELLEIKEREEKLLANISKLTRLPDKGKRIQEFYDKVLAELERRANVDEAAAMFSELNIATKAENALNELEWSGHLDNIKETHATDLLDSDDEAEMDPLRIIASGTMHERTVKVLPSETQLITAEDLAEIASFQCDSTDSGISLTRKTNGVQRLDSESTDSASETSIVDAELVAVDVGEKLNNIKTKLKNIAVHLPDSGDVMVDKSPVVDQHVRYLVTKTELQPAPLQQEKFKPYKTTVSDVHAPEKERMRKKSKHWEITAATPPPMQHNSTQLLTLLDSVNIQTNYLAKLKTLQEQQAAERLSARMERLAQRATIELPSIDELKKTPAFSKYRTPLPETHIEGVQRFNEGEEVHDLLDEECAGGGGVTYTVYD